MQTCVSAPRREKKGTPFCSETTRVYPILSISHNTSTVLRQCWVRLAGAHITRGKNSVDLYTRGNLFLCAENTPCNFRTWLLITWFPCTIDCWRGVLLDADLTQSIIRIVYSQTFFLGMPWGTRNRLFQIVASARRSGQEDFQRGTPPVSLASCSISPILRACIITE